MKYFAWIWASFERLLNIVYFCFLSTKGCKSVDGNRCLFPFTSNNETYYHCSKGIDGSSKFQCATAIAEGSVTLEECDMPNGCMWE